MASNSPAALCLATVAVFACDVVAQDSAAFARQVLTTEFAAEGVAVGDFDRDGHADVVARMTCWFGPAFERTAHFGAPRRFDPLRYSDAFFGWTHDVDADGWLDLVSVGFPGKQAHWLRNPGQFAEPPARVAWDRHVIAASMDNESPLFTDLVGDERPELVFFTGGRAVWAELDPSAPKRPWVLHPISESRGFGAYEHGLGVGDIDGDGRADVLDRQGWWRQPEDLSSGSAWKRHAVDFAVGRRGGAQMLVTDVDGDGDADVITSLDAHGWGLSWFEQVSVDGDGDASAGSRPATSLAFQEHRFMDAAPDASAHGLAVSQLHALALADVDGDGVEDVITGKRTWAHGLSGDPGSDQPPLLLWFRCVRAESGVIFVPRVIDAGSGVGTQVTVEDVDGNGKPDVVVANKKGVFVFRQGDALAAQAFVAVGASSAGVGAVTGTSSARAVAEADGSGSTGVAARADDGRALNLDFETGDLTDWTADGGAFVDQPVRGDAVSERGREPSRHAGKYWVGGFEQHGDGVTGTLTSAAFEVSHPWASFLVGGGSHLGTRVDVVRAVDDALLYRSTGGNYESLQRVVVDLRAYVGKRIAIRLTDDQQGGWGHINFDDFRFHAERPAFERPPGVPLLLPPDPIQHAGLLPPAAAAAMTVPDGFNVDLIAAEPDLHQPIALAIDVAGRLWVAEAHTYPLRAPDGEGRDRILVFEDRDGDASFETRTVFMEGLNLVSGLAVGHGGVWIGAAPWLMFVPDRDDDLVPDTEPQILLDGWAWQDTHETLNSFTWGPDGWLYGCHGVFTHSNVGKLGTPDAKRVPINAGVWRFHPTRHEFEVFAHGTSNPWGIDFDRHGQAFVTACVIPHLWHIVPGGRYERQAGTHFDKDVYEDIGTIADHRHYQGATPHAGNLRSSAVGGGHAHCGALIYQGHSFPDEYRGSILMFNVHGNRINRDVLVPDGSGFIGQHADDFLLSNDAWFRGIALETGPDGSVFFIDWYDEQACHLPREEVWDRTNGRMYRVSYGAASGWQGDLRKLPDEELVELHRHENTWFVDGARLVLAERASRGALAAETEAALGALLEEEDATIRLRGAWSLHVTGCHVPYGALLADSDPAIRGWAMRFLTENREARPAFESELRALANDSSPVVRLEFASYLARVDDTYRQWSVRDLALHDDSDDPNLPLFLWYALKDTRENEITAQIAATTPMERLARLAVRGLVESSRYGGHAIVRALNKVQDPERTALVLGAWVDALPPRSFGRVPSGWTEFSLRLLTSPDATIRDAVRRLNSYYRVGEQDDGALRAVAADRDRFIEERREALVALAPEPANVPLLVVLLDDPELCIDALAALAWIDDPRVAEAVIGHWEDYDADERRQALTALCSRVASARTLMTFVLSGQMDERDLSAGALRTLRSLGDEGIDQQLDAVYGSSRGARVDTDAVVEKWKDLLGPFGFLGPHGVHEPDLPAGRNLFTRLCSQCHVLFDVGGHVGPDLTGSNRRDLDYLLTTIIDPSAVVGRDQMATNVWTHDGRVITGLLREETARTLILATENGDVTLALDEIEERRLSEISMMPEGLLDGLAETEVRDLIGYLQADEQQPHRITAEDTATFFDGATLAGWRGDPALWSVEDGEIVGRTDGLAHNAFLRSELDLADFRLTCEVLLLDDRGNSGIQFRSEQLARGDVAGLQADIGPGWWGKLYDEHGRGLLVDRGASDAVRPGAWNTYEIMAVGSRVRTRLNGQLCVNVDLSVRPHGIIAFQLHSGGPTEVRFRNIRLELDPKLN